MRCWRVESLPPAAHPGHTPPPVACVVCTQLTTTITSLPAVGTLYQISQIFSDYGYQPQRGMALTAASPSNPVVITGSKYRLVYVPPWNTNAPLGQVRVPLVGTGQCRWVRVY